MRGRRGWPDAHGSGAHGQAREEFLLDRGFQVFNTSYPQVQRRLDLRALQLSPFTPGMLLHTGAGRLRFADPSRRPGDQGDLFRGRLAGPGGLAALATLSARDMLLPARLLRHGPDQSTLAALATARIPGDLVELMFRPFLAGVFLEDQLETSGRFFHLVWRSMLRGTLCLPRRGIQAVPGQLAAALPPGTVRLETPVRALTDHGVLLAGGARTPRRRGGGGYRGRRRRGPAAGADRPGHAHRHHRVSRGPGQPAGRADPAGRHRGRDPQHLRPDRRQPGLRHRPRARLHLGAGWRG